ncbi:hypothetical protein CPB85DRAFT_1283536 [Mucidula mucida]|nr:hypothetical protein CPB85DRAFT_1283536 [Mucidula mucida]
MSSSIPTEPRQPLSTSYDQQSAANNRNISGSGSPGLSAFSRLGILAAFVTPSQRHISSVRRGLHDVRTKYGILQKELRLHEDRSTIQYNRLHDNYKALLDSEAVRRQNDKRMEAQVASSSPLRQVQKEAPPAAASEEEPSQLDVLRQQMAQLESKLSDLQYYAETTYRELDNSKYDKGVACRSRREVDFVISEIDKAQSARITAFQQTVTNLQDQIAELRNSLAENVKSAADRDTATHAQFISLRASMKSQFAEVNKTLDELTMGEITRKKDGMRLDLDELATRVANVEDQAQRHDRIQDELNDKVEGLRQVYVETNELAGELKSFIENFKARMVDATEVPDLKSTVYRLSQSMEERLAVLEAKSSTEEMEALTSALRKQQEDLKKAREMQIIAFQVLRDSLVDMASFVEGTEPVIGMKYDNGQANRLRRLAVYLSSYQDQLQDSEKEKN